MKQKLLTLFFSVCGILCASATDYYVSPAGSGTKSGVDAANAWSVTELVTNCNTENSSKFANGDNIHFAGGKYAPLATIYIKMGINLIGATDGERTVFSGDTDGDGVANRDRLFNINTAVAHGTTEKCVNISNIDFQDLKMVQTNETTVGAIYLDNCGALVTISSCNFSNLINTSSATNPSGIGGNAATSKRSNIKFVDCTFTNIKAVSRGVVVRITSDNSTKGYATFERCLFANNEATGATTDPCGLVMMQHGQELNFIDCVFRDNKCNGNGAAIWNGTAPDDTYKRKLNITNTLIYNNTSADNQAIVKGSATTITNSCIEMGTDPRLTISSVGYGTYYLGGASFVMPDGVTGKTISAANDGTLTYGTTYEAGSEVPAGTALLISGSVGQYEPKLKAVAATADTNLLKGSDTEATTTGGDKYYKLANDATHGLGFYWGAEGGAAFNSGAHKAYLAVNGSSAPARFSLFDDEGETTGISVASQSDTLRDGKYVDGGKIVIVRGGVKYSAQGVKL